MQWVTGVPECGDGKGVFFSKKIIIKNERRVF